MARPRKESAEARRRVVKFLLTDAEYAALSGQAQAAQLSPHECARLKVCAVTVQRRGEPAPPSASPAPPLDFELRQELRRVGVNMNQIARRLNLSGEHAPEELREASRHLDALLRRILAALPFR